MPRTPAYAKDRAGLYQTLASTLQHYDINLTEAASGNGDDDAGGAWSGAGNAGE